MPDAPGISIALDDAPLEPDPDFTRFDDTYRVPGYHIERGRQDEFDRTRTGSADFGINDLVGTFDPDVGTNLISKPAAISLHNPVTDTWSYIFRGMVDSHEFTVHPSQKVNVVTVALVDGLDYLSNNLLRFNFNGEWEPPFTGDWQPGNIVYEYDPDNTVDARINQVLTEVGWGTGTGPGRREVFTGNVHLQRSIYTAGTSTLTVIDDAADAEFPGIANRFISRDGRFVFHGRLARFDPTNPDYDLNKANGGDPWLIGDWAAIAGDADYAQIRGFTVSRERQHVINSSLITPQGVEEDWWNTMLVEDLSSIGLYGVQSFRSENLMIHDSVLTGNDARDECVLFSTYYTTCYAEPATRVSQVVVKSLAPSDPRAAAVWKLLCGAEISDMVTLNVGVAGGGTITGDYFIEGITYDVNPLQPDYQDVTMTLNLSPRTWYDFSWT